MNKAFAAALLSGICFAYTPAQAEVLRSLDQVPAKIRGKEAAAEYAYQMNGTAKPDGFGSLARQDTQTLSALLDALAPAEKGAHWSLIGLKPWQNGQQIAVLCAYGEAVQWEYADDKTRYAECSPDAKTIIVALVKRNGDGSFALSAQPYTERFDDTPKPSAFQLENHIGDTVTGRLDRLDLAPYQLNADTRAFGIRYTAHTSYAGGGAFNQNITLFAVVSGRLKPVLSVPAYAFEDLAGEWNADGSRQRHIDETEYLLSVSRTQTNGLRNIVWGKKKTPHAKRRVFRWQPEQQRYR